MPTAYYLLPTTYYLLPTDHTQLTPLARIPSVDRDQSMHDYQVPLPPCWKGKWETKEKQPWLLLPCYRNLRYGEDSDFQGSKCVASRFDEWLIADSERFSWEGACGCSSVRWDLRDISLSLRHRSFTMKNGINRFSRGW